MKKKDFCKVQRAASFQQNHSTNSLYFDIWYNFQLNSFWIISCLNMWEQVHLRCHWAVLCCNANIKVEEARKGTSAMISCNWSLMLLLTLFEPEHVIVQVLQNVAQTIWPRLSSTAVSEIIMHIFTKKTPHTTLHKLVTRNWLSHPWQQEL